MTTETQEHAAWLRGFAAALAAVNRMFDQPTIVKSVMDGDGVTVDALAAAEVESFDLDELRKCCR